MSAYPVLRLDQLPRHRDETLRRGLVDGRALLASLIAENSDDHRSMIRYLTKQLDGMTAELLKRNANSRIEQMISGSSASLSSDFSVLDSAKGSPRMPTPRRDSAAQPPQSAPPALPSSAAPPAWQVPLPSQIRREDAGGDSLAVQAPFGRRKRQSNDSGTGDGDVPSLATSRSVPLLDQNIGGVQTRLTNGVNPSRQSLVALNNAFGVSFVVGATERKRRHVPKKVVVNPEEDMEKSRQNRRKVAMQRLLERQSARKNQNEVIFL